MPRGKPRDANSFLRGVKQVVIRILNVYFSRRIVLLGASEMIVVTTAFIAAMALLRGSIHTEIDLNYQQGALKLALITAVFFVCMSYLDLYDTQVPISRYEVATRLVQVLGSLCIVLAVVYVFFPQFEFAPLIVLTGSVTTGVSLLLWRNAFYWLIQHPRFRERVYVLGWGENAQFLVAQLRSRANMGIDVMNWQDAMGPPLSREQLAERISELKDKTVHRVIVAIGDRRGIIPIPELLNLRFRGVKIEDATALLEKQSGKIEIDVLSPSWLIFSDGFRMSQLYVLARGIVSGLISLILLFLMLPLIPLIALAIRLNSKGPVFYRQARVGLSGRVFYCYKFRTMRADAEADTGPTWASDWDPRITSIGRFLRKSRLDEIPQLWNVLRGDMVFVGPRPERPEFVEWLSKDIPYYQLRHVVRPGITGWAQVRYHYGNTLEDAKEKLKYDLFYIKRISVSLDLLIMFETIRVVILGRGAK